MSALEEVADPEAVLSWVQRVERQVEELELALQHKSAGRAAPKLLHNVRFSRFVQTRHEIKGRGTPLADASVVVVGVGGVGSFLADGLARTGLGRLGLVDKGMVAPEHVGNGVFRQQHVGWEKATCARRLAESLSPNTVVESEHADVEDTAALREVCTRLGIEKPDLLVSALNCIKARLAVSSWCVRNAVPFLDICARESWPAATLSCYIQKDGASGRLSHCLRCDDWRQDGPGGGGKDACSGSKDGAPPGHSPSPPSWASSNAIVAGLALQRVVKVLALGVDNLEQARFGTRVNAMKATMEVSAPSVPLASCSCRGRRVPRKTRARPGPAPAPGPGPGPGLDVG